MKNSICLLICSSFFVHSIFAQTTTNAQVNALQSTFASNPYFTPWTGTNLATDNTSPLVGTSRSDNSGDITISNFDPIVSVVQGNPDGISANPSDAAHTNMVTQTLNSLSGSDYEISFSHQHDYIPNGDTDNDRDYYFRFEFDLENNSGSNTLHYVIFYQNETYKYPEKDATLFKSGENFYGSWGFDEDGANTGLRQITHISNGQMGTVRGYFRIRGNPRNEGPPFGQGGWSDNLADDWRMDRWKRLPRMGEYRFMVVVTSDPNFFTTQDRPYLIDAGEMYNGASGNDFISPFHWRELDGSMWMNNTAVLEANEVLNVFTKVDGVDFNQALDVSGISHPRLGFQLLNEASTSASGSAVPVYSAIGDFTQTDYNWQTHFHNQDELVDVTYGIVDENAVRTSASGESLDFVIDGTNEDCIESVIHKGAAKAKYRLMTYGKFTIKMKFPSLYNAHDVWKGIANTFWFDMGTQDYNRVYCNGTAPDNSQLITPDFNLEFFYAHGGHTYYPDNNPSTSNVFPDPDTEMTLYRAKQYDVSLWDTHIFPTSDFPHEADKISILLSNGDSGCTNVENPIGFNSSVTLTYPYSEPTISPTNEFTITRGTFNPSEPLNKQTGAKINYGRGSQPCVDGQPFCDDDDYFPNTRPYYYYQFEWKPNEIIFRMGPEENMLEVWGWYPSSHTVIANKTMSMILGVRCDPETQGSLTLYPAEEWVRHTPRFLPIWIDDIEGELLEFKIE